MLHLRLALKPLARVFSALLLLCTLVAATPLRTQAAAVTSSSFYTATEAAYNAWLNSTSNNTPRPAKTVSFPSGTSTVAFYFEYYNAVKGVTTNSISVFDSNGKLVGSTGSHAAEFVNGLVMRKITYSSGPYPDGTYSATLKVAGAPDLSTSFSVGSVSVPTGGVTLAHFYPATKTAYDTWSNSTSTARPPKTSTFPAGTSVIAFYFEYDGATPKVTSYKVSIYDVGGALIGAAGPYKAQYTDGLVMRTVPGPSDGAFASGSYRAVVTASGAASLTTTFIVGGKSLSISTFYPATKAAYDAFGAPNGPNPKQITNFPAGTKQIAFFFAYTKATPKTNTFQIVIRDKSGGAVATGNVHAFPYTDGTQMLLFGQPTDDPFSNGSYRADLLVNGQVANSIFFSVGVATTSATPACLATDYIATCLEPSILRLHADLAGNMAAEGTGFVIQSDSTGTYLLTNKHVVDGATPAKMKAYSPDGGTTYTVLAVARNSAAEGTAGDLAVVKLPPSNLRPLKWGNSDALVLLQSVISIGYGDAFDLPGPPTVTQGSISALHRDLGDGFGPVWIQHQSFINHGNSGGPLLDKNFQVVGVNTLSFKDTQGIFFAIPSNYARTIAAQLIAKLNG